MIYSTATVPVNPEGETKLTRAQAWAGLELKARDARLFLPPGLCTRCDVVEESATRTEIVEIIIQMSLYAGFPAALNAISALRTVLEARKKGGLECTPGLRQ